MRLREPMPELVGATEWLNDQVSKHELVGFPTLFHFWSVSCHLCKKAMPEVRRLREEYPELRVIAVHMPRKEEDRSIKAIELTAREHEIMEPIFVDANLTLTEAFGNQYVPAYYLFDRSAHLRHFQAGGGSLRMLEKRIVRMLDES